VSDGYRCSAAAVALAEPMEGTASTVRAFVLVESPGPWGVDALRESRLPGEVRARLQRLQVEHAIRPLLIRRHAGARPATTRIFAAYVDPARPWLETAELDDARQLLDVDLTALADGGSPGLTSHDDPLLLVCTHGRHDACCAERGRPLCAALHAAAPEHTWEVSHIGGDRFAANLLVLPHGLYYGRVPPEHAAALAGEHLAGRLDLAHLRGRSSYPFRVQAAEVFLRRHLDDRDVAPYSLRRVERRGDETVAEFATAGGVWEVRVQTSAGPARRLTCRAGAATAPPVHRLADLRRL
jgi:hypothetical protein